ncbi:hypothetical protein ACN6LA_006909 [Streptomyces sp. SAS_269]|uniref:ATP-dependent DNA ligase n=1 Tax=Streptomyces sp. SAS_269 TaxID=3412749 RepID=UPI00403CC2E9
MLTVAVDSPALPAGWAAEPKWDGYRAQLAAYAGVRVLLRSRQGTDMTGSFPEVRAAALAQLPADTGLDDELIVWESHRLAFERLQQRLARRGALLFRVRASGRALRGLRPGPPRRRPDCLAVHPAPASGVMTPCVRSSWCAPPARSASLPGPPAPGSVRGAA